MGLRGVWGHVPLEKFEKLKPLKCDFHDSDSCKRLSIYLLNRCFSFIILLSYPFLNLPCLTLNYIWDRNSSCLLFLKNSRRDLINNHQRAYLFIVADKVAWGRLGKSISLNSGFACEIATLIHVIKTERKLAKKVLI